MTELVEECAENKNQSREGGSAREDFVGVAQYDLVLEKTKSK